MASSMDDSDDEFDPIVPPDNELDKVQGIDLHVCTTIYMLDYT